MPDPRLYRRLYALLSAQIDNGTLAPGERLHIGALAAQHRTSRDTVQKAIGLLEADHRVERWPGLGWYVHDASGDSPAPSGGESP